MHFAHLIACIFYFVEKFTNTIIFNRFQMKKCICNFFYPQEKKEKARLL